ncbi:hypothetical protein [Paenibacillus thermotolerans]|uniref:hypothetical protein n=1 Tax=Paenibacillus thermotolerans TaxID=3027807 RepID=UPI002367A781|nr:MULTISPECIES: hypothetical protein [unclassified Paenibacillus]
MTSNLQEANRRTLYIYKVVSLVLTAGIGALGLLIWFYVRECVMTMLMVFGADPFSWRAVDNFSTILLGMLWLTLVLISPHLMLKGGAGIRFWKHAALLFGVLLAVLLVSQLIPWALGAADPSAGSLLLMAAEAAGGLLLTVFYFIGKSDG